MMIKFDSPSETWTISDKYITYILPKIILEGRIQSENRGLRKNIRRLKIVNAAKK